MARGMLRSSATMPRTFNSGRILSTILSASSPRHIATHAYTASSCNTTGRSRRADSIGMHLHGDLLSNGPAFGEYRTFGRDHRALQARYRPVHLRPIELCVTQPRRRQRLCGERKYLRREEAQVHRASSGGQASNINVIIEFDPKRQSAVRQHESYIAGKTFIQQIRKILSTLGIDAASFVRVTAKGSLRY